MTRAAFRQSDLTRAIRAYRDATGTLPVVKVEGGRAILSQPVESPAEPQTGANSCDDAFGVTP